MCLSTDAFMSQPQFDICLTLTTKSIQAHHHYTLIIGVWVPQQFTTRHRRGGHTVRAGLSFQCQTFCHKKNVAGNMSTDPAFMFEPQLDSENLIYGIHCPPLTYHICIQWGCQRCLFKMHIQVMDSSFFLSQALVWSKPRLTQVSVH